MRRRWVEDYIQDQGEFIWVVSHALWTDQCAKHLHVAYEWGTKEIFEIFFIVYLDDIFIFSKSLDEHLLHIRSVLERLREEKLLINLKKCSLGS